ncbi:Cloroperoxidase [Sistotremastrum suecicum HHB10207 ss-3]|uniref:Cloroperoxidase n=1 Tax=Sistotremastrum suecicum HHB10207 ss-3 TaxID=1314776 RepID=A0A165XUM7_9AGAM|nr:Cloroperoxidase [Sistotremastrum suecicum HHB10207 ss-3]
MSRIFGALKGAISGIFSTLSKILSTGYVFTWDFGLTFINLVTPNKKSRIGTLSEGESLWPPYVPPQEGDSRCSCPALNAMANHGILPHDGRNIKFTELSKLIHETYNFAPSFCYFVPNYAADFLGRDYKTGTMDLNDLDVHNCIEHDASLTRWDAKKSPDQSKPALELVHALLANATGDGGKTLTVEDLSRFTAIRRAHSKATNGQFTLSSNSKFFGSSNSGTLVLFFGGKVDDLKIFLTEERLPERWESTVRSRTGMTMALFNITAAKIESGIAGAKTHVE